MKTICYYLWSKENFKIRFYKENKNLYVTCFLKNKLVVRLCDKDILKAVLKQGFKICKFEFLDSITEGKKADEVLFVEELRYF